MVLADICPPVKEGGESKDVYKNAKEVAEYITSGFGFIRCSVLVERCNLGLRLQSGEA